MFKKTALFLADGIPYCGSVELALNADPVRSVVKVDENIDLHNRLEILVLQISKKI